MYRFFFIDRQFTHYKKMRYKYKDNFKEFLSDLESLFYTKLPLKDFDGNPIVYIESRADINNNIVKTLSHSQNESYGFKSTENEIIATSAIESIDFSRESVRNILKGFAPKDEEENKRYSGKIDITPFLIYFADNVYNAYNEKTTDENLLREYKKYLDNGEVTEKESQLWKFVLSNYGTDEFSTKMLEKDFQNAAYATIRGFVQKFERLGLLSSTKYGTRIKYKINT